jgi:hypothetical protein
MALLAIVLTGAAFVLGLEGIPVYAVTPAAGGLLLLFVLAIVLDVWLRPKSRDSYDAVCTARGEEHRDVSSGL